MKGQRRDAPQNGKHRADRRRRWPIAVFIAAPALVFLPSIGSKEPALAGAWLAFAFAIAYEVPSIVAYSRQMPNRAQVYVINVLTGWTVIGWIVALVMAVGARKD
jgi:Superinfection immunity protein